ncbi:DUF1822 family protein [Cyanobacterium aponinum]|uniref:DUF1822 family protein n=1 Tax=Cyanobacterium aponinum 0216 TaxID=2676140 RepID=A0A844GUC5_9CHRO|nr:DUF1822 family protein [Cyanobacterium aponinum]MTF40087.1 DUF1822 family protein [Cyanobacterium aponinum 0216]
MSLDLFTAFNSEDLWLKFSDKEYNLAMEKAKNFASLAEQHQALINFLASNCLIKWLNMTYGDLISQVNFEFEDKDLFSIWQFVNGTPLIINNLSRRLIVLPEECEDLSEFNIPQEWLDIPQLRGDYFLPVQVNLETGWLRFYGFTTYEYIKKYSYYNRYFAYYILPEHFLDDDLNLIFLFEKYQLFNHVEYQALPQFSSVEKRQFIEQLNNIEASRVRHHLNFVQWAALFADKSCRLSLYKKYQPISLGSWLENNFYQAYSQGWQNLTDLMDSLNFITSSPSVSNNGIVMRSGNVNLEYIYQINDEKQLKVAAQRLSVLPTNSVHKNQVLQALNYIMSRSHDDETRWHAAEGIWRLEPNNPNAGLWCGKRLNLGVEMGDLSLALVIGVLPKSDSQNSIFFRLYPTNNHLLPANLNVQIMDEETKVFKQLTSREGDRILQYKFWGNKGEFFWIQMNYHSTQLSEAFII